MQELKYHIAAAPVPAGLTATYLVCDTVDEYAECPVVALVVEECNGHVELHAYVINTFEVDDDNKLIERADKVRGGMLLDISIKKAIAHEGE